MGKQVRAMIKEGGIGATAVEFIVNSTTNQGLACRLFHLGRGGSSGSIARKS